MSGIRNQQPIYPRGSAGGYPLGPWLILGGCCAAVVLTWLGWLAGRVAAVLSGRPWDTGPPFGWDFTARVVGGDWQQLWPGVAPLLVAVTYTVLLTMAIVPSFWGWAWWQAHRPQAGDPLPLARPHDVDELVGATALRRAQRLRPSLAGINPRQVPAAAIGIALGRLVTARRRRGPVLRSSWEDVLLAVMAPRAGKTTALAVPPILDAPGPVIATSNRSDVWAATARARQRVGRVWLFDPQRVTRQPQAFWWDPLSTITGGEEAARLADHFIQEIRGVGSSDPFWPLAAGDLLTSLFLAAANSGGTLADVQAWLSDVTSREPVTLLRAAGFPRPPDPSQAGKAARPRPGTGSTRRRGPPRGACPTRTSWPGSPHRPPTPAGST